MSIRKENAFWGSPSLFRVAYCYQENLPLVKEFRPHCLSRKLQKLGAQETLSIRVDLPMYKAVHMEPFSTSIFKIRVWIFATTTKICTDCDLTQASDLRFEVTISPPTHLLLRCTIKAGGYWLSALAPIHFRASPFGKWVVTQSLAGFNFHDHRPAVKMNHTLCGVRWANTSAPYTAFRFIPHRQFCLPKRPTKCLHCDSESNEVIQDSYPFKVWEIGQEHRVPKPLVIRFTWYNCLTPAILRETSKGTSY